MPKRGKPHLGKGGKSHKGIRKRMKLTANKQVVKSHANTGHLLSGKSGQRKRRLRKGSKVHETQLKTYVRLIVGGL
jgi:large subunit ribosomal protein L35